MSLGPRFREMPVTAFCAIVLLWLSWLLGLVPGVNYPELSATTIVSGAVGC
jgi:hypothetical protein